MAGKSLGTLTIDLVAKVGGFVSGLSQAERASQKWRKQVKDDAKAAAVAFTGFATAASAAALSVGVAGYNLLKNTSKQITESDRWAKSLNMSTQSLLSWQYAAQKAGVSGDQMADIFKDIGDKIGDAVLNKSGEAVDALDALGLSAKKLSGESPDKQLLAISDALSKIKTNSEKTTILESLGNDLSKLLPLLDQGGDKLQKYLKAAKDFGVAPDDADIESLVKVNSIFEDMETQINGVKIELATGLAKVDLSNLQKSISDMGDVFKDPEVIKGITNLVGGVVDLATWLVKVGAEAGKLIDLYKGGTPVGENASKEEIERRIRNLTADLEDDGFAASFNRIGMDTEGKRAEREQLRRRLSILETANNLPLTPAKVGDSSSTKTGYGLGKDESNGKLKTDASAKKLESAFKSMETSYLRQIALIDTTGKKSAEVTEQQKLQFDIADGKLTGLNETQKQRLEQLATEVDRLNAVKKANEENLKLAEYISNLQRENANAATSLDADVIGAGLGDKARERMREQLEIEREFNEKREDLQRRRQDGSIKTSEEYDRYNQELDKALAERLDKYRSHYDQLDELQGNWLAGAQNGLANWVDTSSDYYTQVSDLVGNTLDGLVDNMADALSGNKADWASWANSVLNELQKVLLRAIMVNTLKSAGDSGWFGSLGGMFGSSVAGAASAGGATPSGAYTGAASQLKFAKGGVMDSPDLSRFRNGVVNSPTMFAFAKGAGLMGEAGPEAIMPLTRTADGNLGVRMVDDTVSSVGGGGAQLQQTIHQHFSISGNGDAALKQAMQEAARQGANDGAKQARQDLLQDFSNRGQARRLLGV
ncbi:phage tail tape measure protein [Salmonella enterica subsp. enterica serovar Cubana]|uniref:Phage tail tape measure protein n=1 Tax=Salmonella enterica subsp. enterica serovar Cubana TaxID=189201 RepID=A0A5W5STQ3_SALET|nr:phage tail tape measure protein [Salmonella enterica]MCV9716914.1 phage tail tape measure protein [Salmonella enterica subsp. enterica serovar Senftenberg]EAR9861605.1 phage tail tape measure protein [Salmonella enterica subsp. enterica serovar Cubana]EBU8248684.1 phage tail tape measure protein [Salmonella enterica subsp. enterica serovar Cubana]EBW2357915.1 phage tail tape measure protein [Salmonella enterica subsp. enterica serovar Cubana]EBX2833976.1 phage tail tape measure protein [Sal